MFDEFRGLQIGSMNKWMSKTTFMVLFNACTGAIYWMEYGFVGDWISVASILLGLLIVNALVLRSMKGVKWHE